MKAVAIVQTKKMSSQVKSVEMELKYFQEVESFISWPLVVIPLLSFLWEVLFLWEFMFQDILEGGNVSALEIALTTASGSDRFKEFRTWSHGILLNLSSSR